MSYDSIVIGAGAAGVAAAATLGKAGRRVLLLEAGHRIGGRVETVPFGDGLAELGAHLIHGSNSSAYKIGIQNNVALQQQPMEFKVHRSDGSVVDEEIALELVKFCVKVIDEPPATPQPLGDYITARLQDYISTKYPSRASDKNFFRELIGFVKVVINNRKAADSWNDVTTFTNYQEMDGTMNSWHDYGYKTLFEILLNKYNNGKGIPNLEIKFNSEVTKITWNPDSSSKVQVQVADGNTYTADNVIVTVSLGVLKERHASLFSPPLPNNKKDVIEKYLSMGVTGKIFLHFPTKWWDDTDFMHNFYWTEKDSSDESWERDIVQVDDPKGASNVLTIWTYGKTTKLTETKTNEELKTRSMEIIRRFMGKNREIPDPVNIIKSTWYSNPFIRGSYAYDNLETLRHPEARVTLAAPLKDKEGVSRVLFAGEATSEHHFGTVHGAIDTGITEANRILGQS